MTKDEFIIGFFEKGYCLDLDEVKNVCLGLLKENKELKRQLEDKEEYLNKLQATKDRLNKYNYEITMQQQEFIEWLEAMSRMYENEYKDIDIAEHYNCVLTKYKEIIGVKYEKIND